MRVSGPHQLALQLFQRLALGLGIDKQHHNELHRSHDRKKHERRRRVIMLTTTGNICAMIAFMNQWLALPTPCPLERTEVGNTSPMYTQITAPCEMRKKAM